MRTRGPRALTVYGVAAVIVIVAYAIAPPELGADLHLAAVAASAAACTLGIRIHRPPHALPWRWLQAGLVATLAATVIERFTGSEAVWLWSGRLLQLGGYLCAAAMAWTLGRQRTREDAVDQVLASTIAATAGAIVAFVFVVQPLWRLDTVTGGSGLLRAAFPVLSLGIAGMLLRYLASWPSTNPASSLVAAGLVAFFLADLLGALGLVVAAGTPGSVLGQLVAYALVGAATLHPSIADRPHEDPGTGHGFSRLELAAVLLAGVAGPLSLVAGSEAATRLELTVVGAGSAILVTLVVVRCWRFVVALREHARREHEERFRVLVENTGDVVCVVAADGEVTYVSPSAERVWGYSREEMAASVLGMVAENDRCEVRRTYRDVLGGQPGATARVEGRGMHGDGTWRSFEAVLANRLDDPAVRGVVVTSRDITDRHELEQRLWSQAYIDQLTGLPNRGLLLDRLDAALRVGGGGRHPLLLVFGLDDLKTINDSLGSQRGDELLRTIARRLQRGAVEGATVARLGGDEFALLLPQSECLAAGEAIAVRALAAIARPVNLAGRRIEPQASCGVATARGTLSPTELLRNAEAAMHVAKLEERGSYRVFDPDMYTAAVRRLQLQMDLGAALEKDQLWVAYQPIHEIRTGRMVGVEALLRWDHPVRGSVPPDEFIPLAESTGRIGELGRFVLRRACHDVVAAGETCGLPLSLSVNLSPAQLGDPALTEMVAAALDESGLAPHRLTLEVTEGVFLERSDRVLDALGSLRTLGVRLAIDDFGTGYCALGYLTTFRFDVVKIDRSFIRVLDGEAGGDRRVTLGILELVSKLEVPAVAEGIETEAQLGELRAIGCEFGQGYHWSRPVPVDQLPLPSSTRNAVRSTTDALPEVSGSGNVCAGEAGTP